MTRYRNTYETRAGQRLAAWLTFFALYLALPLTLILAIHALSTTADTALQGATAAYDTIKH